MLSKLSISIWLSYFPFRFIIFRSDLMPCERINCAQCLSFLALKNDPPGVAQFLSNIPKSILFDTYLGIPSDALSTWVMVGCLRPKEYGHLKAYCLADFGEPHLVSQDVIREQPIRQTDPSITSVRFTWSSKDGHDSALTSYHRSSARTWWIPLRFTVKSW